MPHPKPTRITHPQPEPFSDFVPIDTSKLRATAFAPVRVAIEPAAPEIWVEVAELVFCTLRASPSMVLLEDDVLARCAVGVVYQLAHDLGGVAVYLPKGVKLKSDQKRRAIAAEFKGHNQGVLAKKHGLTEVRIRQILSETKKP